MVGFRRLQRPNDIRRFVIEIAAILTCHPRIQWSGRCDDTIHRVGQMQADKRNTSTGARFRAILAQDPRQRLCFEFFYRPFSIPCDQGPRAKPI